MEILKIIIDTKSFSSKDIESLGIMENKYLRITDFADNSEININTEELENFDCLVTAKELRNAVKKISNGFIIEHLNRDDYKKLTYPLYLKSETFINFLNENKSEWNLVKFLETHTFKITQI
tara:strand:- start:561 stop:926 length:366 start_codon:yes stop_codon:yes gene_type:complete